MKDQVESNGIANLHSAISPLQAVPIWRQVLMLAWPVLVQQLLNFSVGLSDQFLAGYFPQIPLDQQREAVGHELLALGQFAMTAPGAGVTPAVAASISADQAWQIMARQVAYQAAQTTANYLAWFISSYTVLVSVGSIALVSRFVGAGDWRLAIHVTNQSIVLAVIMGLAGTVVGLAGVHKLVALLQLEADAARFAAEYLVPLFALLVFQIVEQAGIACLIGAGDTRTGLWVLGGVAIVNVPLAWFFFHGLGPISGLGFTGIALGTAVSH